MWKLSDGAFWRRSGEDILVVTANTVLRLNAASALLFEVAIGTCTAEASQQSEFAAFVDLMVQEGILEANITQYNGWSQHLEAVP